MFSTEVFGANAIYAMIKGIRNAILSEIEKRNINPRLLSTKLSVL